MASSPERRRLCITVSHSRRRYLILPRPYLFITDDATFVYGTREPIGALFQNSNDTWTDEDYHCANEVGDTFIMSVACRDDIWATKKPKNTRDLF